MATNKSETSPLEAFSVYAQMGPKRSIAGLEAKMHDLGHKVSRTTLMRWQKKFGWDKHIASELEAQARELKDVAQQAATKLREEEAKGEPFTAHETMEGTANALQAMTASMALVVTAAMQRYLERRDSVALDLKELLQIARSAGEAANAAATLHRALYPAPAPTKGKSADPERDRETGLLEGALMPGTSGPPGVEELIAVFSNPPIART